MKNPILARSRVRQKTATATYKDLVRVFTLPESEQSTLGKIEKQISHDLLGFLKEHIVSGDLSPKEIEKNFSETVIADDPIFVSEQADFLLNKVVAQSVHTSSPSFIGHMTSALPYFMLPLSKIMFALNQNLVKIETSKAFTPLERQVLGMIHRLIYNQSDSFYKTHVQNHHSALGSFCSGGTVANLTALWVARNLMFPKQKDFPGIHQAGLVEALQYYKLKNIAILMSERAHYSIEKTAHILGLGSNSLVKINTTSDQKMDVSHLRLELKRLKRENIGVLAIIGIAGTTESGSIDPLTELGKIAKEHKCYFHVDAAWGGPTLFSEKNSHLLQGIELADSVTFDAHKQLYVPVGGGMVLFKNPKHLQAIKHHAQYIIRKGSRDLGKYTLEGSRPGMAMLTHSSLRILGKKGLGMLIDLGIEKAQMFASMIEAYPEFELLAEPQLNLVNYRFVPLEIQKSLVTSKGPDSIELNHYLNQLTVAIQKEQRRRGKTFVSRTSLVFGRYKGQEITVFRAVLANPLTTPQILKDVLDEQVKIAKSLLNTKKLKPPKGF